MSWPSVLVEQNDVKPVLRARRRLSPPAQRFADCRLLSKADGSHGHVGEGDVVVMTPWGHQALAKHCPCNSKL